jgi:hypothetical protein
VIANNAKLNSQECCQGGQATATLRPNEVRKIGLTADLGQ